MNATQLTFRCILCFESENKVVMFFVYVLVGRSSCRGFGTALTLSVEEGLLSITALVICLSLVRVCS